MCDMCTHILFAIGILHVCPLSPCVHVVFTVKWFQTDKDITLWPLFSSLSFPVVAMQNKFLELLPLWKNMFLQLTHY